MHDPFPTPFTNEALESIGLREEYSFTNGFFGYLQIKIAKEGQHETTFAIEWGCFQYTTMQFRLNNAPSIFYRIVVAAFKYFIHKFLEFYFDDRKVYGLIKDHIESLWIMLECCGQFKNSLNVKKCISLFPSWYFVGSSHLRGRNANGHWEDCNHYQFTTTFVR